MSETSVVPVDPQLLELGPFGFVLVSRRAHEICQAGLVPVAEPRDRFTHGALPERRRRILSHQNVQESEPELVALRPF